MFIDVVVAGGRSVGIVRSWTKAMEFSLVLDVVVKLLLYGYCCTAVCGPIFTIVLNFIVQ
jgi:hypothetical protein